MDRRNGVSLSLEIKKFINSEHVGEFATILLPIEIPAEQPRTSRVFRAKERAQAQSAAASMESILEATAQQAQGEGAPQPQPQPQTAPPIEEPAWQAAPRIEYEATRIHYIEDGEGEPLILVHSIAQSGYTWRNVFYRLREHYRVIVVDLPGHGYSDRPLHFDYTIEAHAMALRLFMDALRIESAHFAAFSMGSLYAMQLSLDYPERVGRLVLVTPGGITGDMPMPVKLMDSGLFGGIASRLYGMGTVRKVLEDCFFDLTNINDDVIEQYYKPASDPDGRRCIRTTLQSFDEEGILHRLRDMSVPVLILQGSEDKWHKAEDVDIFHAALRDAGFAVVRNAGHLLHEEKPDRFVAAVLEFIPVMMPE
ncbi:MAG: alpha/beta hydrolase [Clostridia bacterium]|nr:alpha/beta hydrolase [Clostridia bacterium]